VDLVVTDLVMPQMGGRELVEQLSSTFSNLRALFMTGYTADNAVPSELPGVKMALLYKPFMAGTLLTRVRKLLDRDRGVPS
jgi:DNA-binding response OmpR family regulator